MRRERREDLDQIAGRANNTERKRVDVWGENELTWLFGQKVVVGFSDTQGDHCSERDDNGGILDFTVAVNRFHRYQPD